MVLTGTFHRSLDEKFRFAIPRRLREAMGVTEGALYLAPGTDGSLAVYTEAAFARLGDQFGMRSPNAQDVRAFSRLFYAQAQRVTLDRQGRLRIPPELARLASLGREVVLLGVRDHLEIWDREHWGSYLGQKQACYDQIAESAFDARKEGTLPRSSAAGESPSGPTESRPVLPR